MNEETPTPSAPASGADDGPDQPQVSVDAALESTMEVAEEQSGSRPLALNFDEANKLAAKCRPTVLILAGAVATGKTSVYAALYERFGRGPFAGRLFAGSTTIPGFEKRCHGWRLISGASEPKMDHTQLSDLQWLHLRIRDEERERPVQDLLFGDYNGEIFDELASGGDAQIDYSFLRRADHVGVVLDGEKLCDPTQREATLQRSVYLVEQLLSDDHLASPQTLFVVLSKLDLVVGAGERQREASEDGVRQISSLIKERTGGYEPPILRLAARSTSDRFPLGHGLNELLDLVTERPALHVLNGPPAKESTDFFSGFTA